MNPLALSNLTKTALLALTISACGGGGSGGMTNGDTNAAGNNNSTDRQYPQQPLNCGIDEMKKWVDANMRDYYLFYDQVPSIELAQYSDLQSLIDALSVKPFDRFSYITDAAQNTALFDEGVSFGFGWRLIRTTESDVQFGFVYPQSPMAAANVSRGDYLIAINGVHPLDMTGDQWDDFLGTGDKVVTPSITVLSKSGVTRTIDVTKAKFSLDTVLDHRIFDTSNGKTGYMHFTSFLETSNAEIDEAFTEFQDNAITDLILDLRYNGGGRISVANKLASKIVGADHAGQVFAEVSFNQKYSNNDVPYNLVVPEIDLNLSRLIVLSSPSTCSASEMIINGLKPFIDVVQIGGTSCGKPYGSSPHEACGKAMNALQFRFVNADGEGDYYNGIEAKCQATDNVNNALGDASEPMLAAALNYVQNASCQVGLASENALAPSNAAQQVSGPQSFDTTERSGEPAAMIRSTDPLKSESNIYR